MKNVALILIKSWHAFKVGGLHPSLILPSCYTDSYYFELLSNLEVFEEYNLYRVFPCLQFASKLLITYSFETLPEFEDISSCYTQVSML